MRLERLGLFSPIFRVRTPQVDYPLFHIPVRRGNNWFTNNWAWDTTGIPQKYEVPDPKDRSQEGYYSVFQIDYLDLVLAEMTIHVQWDSFLDRSGGYRNIDWKRIGNRWMDFAEAHLESLRSHEYRRSVALLCQYISNRYYPKTQGDQRTLQVGGGIYSDHWIFLNGHDWDWDREIEEWDPREAARLFRLDRTPVIRTSSDVGFPIITPEGGPKMKKKRFTEEKIIGILKEHEAGATAAVLARCHGVSEQSIYRWKAKFGGLEVSDAKRLRALESENAKLKRLLADSLLDNAALKEIARGKW